MTNDKMPTDAITVQYDIDGTSVWEGFAQITRELGVDDSGMILSAYFGGYAPNGCGILEVQFANLDVAKGFTAVYMGRDADDWDVLEYLGIVEDGRAA